MSSDVVDGVSSVSAGATFVSMVGSALIGARSVTLEVNNNTNKVLRRYPHGLHLDHGRFVRWPAAAIAPQGFDVFSAASKDPSVMTGTEGYVRYTLDDDHIRLMMTCGWDNPYFGDNRVRGRLDWPDAKAYVMFGFRGDGNTAAPFRFELFEASRFPDREGGKFYIEEA